jgi:hypothetical protein
MSFFKKFRMLFFISDDIQNITGAIMVQKYGEK